jgi:hypothetical protein
MKILVVGGDTKGAWQMRGVQLGRAIGARVTAEPGVSDWAWADVVVLVKRAAMMWQAQAQQCRVPVIWDALDFWAQPEDNAKPREALISDAIRISRSVGASKIICATQAMAADLGGVYLPHHGRAGMTPIPPRTMARVVGYDGTPKYLGRWRAELEATCASLGLTFVVNPPDLHDVDVFVSFRDGRWDGWVCRQWKSGVKHVNALLAGRPIVSQPSAAAHELYQVSETVESQEELTDRLKSVLPLSVREDAYQRGRAMADTYAIDTIARDYLTVLRDVARRAA